MWWSSIVSSPLDSKVIMQHILEPLYIITSVCSRELDYMSPLACSHANAQGCRYTEDQPCRAMSNNEASKSRTISEL